MSFDFKCHAQGLCCQDYGFALRCIKSFNRDRVKVGGACKGLGNYRQGWLKGELTEADLRDMRALRQLALEGESSSRRPGISSEVELPRPINLCRLRPRHHYKLEGHTVVTCDVMEWMYWFETADRSVALTELDGGRVSTVFLGLDHQWTVGGQPLLFETMIFGNEQLADEQWHYSTWEEAYAGHTLAVKLLESVLTRVH